MEVSYIMLLKVFKSIKFPSFPELNPWLSAETVLCCGCAAVMSWCAENPYKASTSAAASQLLLWFQMLTLASPPRSARILLPRRDPKRRSCLTRRSERYVSVVKSRSIPLPYRSLLSCPRTRLSLAGGSTGNIGFRVSGNYLKCGRKNQYAHRKPVRSQEETEAHFKRTNRAEKQISEILLPFAYRHWQRQRNSRLFFSFGKVFVQLHGKP